MFNSCEYIISAASKKQFPNTNNLNEYVFLGRSNVGKSSFINSLTNRKNLAYTSSKPGKTIAINFYLIDKKYYLVDVPGYGFAVKSAEEKEKFGQYIENYLIDNKNLKIAFLLIDTKVGPTKDDILMYNYLQYYSIEVIIIATKCDKVGTTVIGKHKKEISKKLNVIEEKVILTSAQTKKGIEEVRKLLY